MAALITVESKVALAGRNYFFFHLKMQQAMAEIELIEPHLISMLKI